MGDKQPRKSEENRQTHIEKGRKEEQIIQTKTQQNQKTHVGRLAQFISFFSKIEMKN